MPHRTLHDAEDARIQANERYNQLQDANFELERGPHRTTACHGDFGVMVEGSK